MIARLKNIARRVRDDLKFKLSPIGENNFSAACPTTFHGNPSYHTFIGYYDIQPFNDQQSHLLASRCSSKHNKRALDQKLELGVIDLKTNEFHKFEETKTWCWQQGARLHWINWEGQQCALFNDLDDKGILVTRIFDVFSNKQITSFPLGTYAFHADNKKVASLDFNGLQYHRPGYGYDYKEQKNIPEAYVSVFDIDSGKTKKILTAETAQSINPHPSMEGAVHYFNHLHFNASGKRLMAFHIWDKEGKRCVRALTMDIDGTNVVDVTGGTHVSHYWWINETDLLFYCTDVKYGAGFHIYNQSGQYLKSLGGNVPKGDGHPSLHPNLDGIVLSDTLVDEKFNRELWIHDMAVRDTKPLAMFKSPPKFAGETRCDLHPRWSSLGNMVAVDTAHKGFRQICVLDVAKMI